MTLNYDCNVRSGELVDYISGMPSSKEILQAMDEISDAVGFKFFKYIALSIYQFVICIGFCLSTNFLADNLCEFHFGFLKLVIFLFNMYIVHNHVT